MVLKRKICVSLVYRIYTDNTSFDYVVYVNVDGKSYSYGFGDAYDIALKTFDEQVAKKESDCLSEVDNSRIDSLHKIVERKANQIVLMKRFLSDLKYMKGEN